MSTSILFRHAIFRVAACATLAGLCIMAGATGAAARTIPASHRGTARPARRGATRRTTEFAKWPMFRGDLAHTGVSPETGINTTTAPTLTPDWSASLGTASFSPPAVVNLKSLGEPVMFVGGSSGVNAYLASDGTRCGLSQWGIWLIPRLRCSMASSTSSRPAPTGSFALTDPGPVFRLRGPGPVTARAGHLHWPDMAAAAARCPVPRPPAAGYACAGSSVTRSSAVSMPARQTERQTILLGSARPR